MNTEVSGKSRTGIAYDYIDVRAPWEPVGERLPVVFQHGVGLDRRMWYPWARRLAVERPVVAIDLRGHGGSAAAWKESAYPFEQFAQDIFTVIEECEVSACHLVGESFGGTVGLALAATARERVASVTTCSSAWKGSWINNVGHWEGLLREEGGVERWSRALTESRFVLDRVPDPLVQWVRQMQDRIDPEIVIALLRCLLGVDLEPQLPNIVVPVMNILGQSPFVDLRNFRELPQLVDQAQSVYIPEARHGIVMSHWEECCNATVEFIRRTERGMRDAGVLV